MQFGGRSAWRAARLTAEQGDSRWAMRSARCAQGLPACPPPHTHTCPHTHSPTPAPPPIHTHTPAPPQAEHLGIKQAGLRMDSQVKYGLLSRGDASIFMRFPPTSYREKIWDHLPGFIIVEEAGGKVTDGTGKRLDFSKGRFLDLTNGLISAPPTVHAALVEAIAKVTLPL